MGGRRIWWGKMPWDEDEIFGTLQCQGETNEMSGGGASSRDGEGSEEEEAQRHLAMGAAMRARGSLKGAVSARKGQAFREIT